MEGSGERRIDPQRVSDSLPEKKGSVLVMPKPSNQTFFLRNSEPSGSDDETFHDALPPISLDDFMNSITKMQTSRVHAELLHIPTI